MKSFKMGKKKKKKKKSLYDIKINTKSKALKDLDKNLNKSYDKLMGEIEDIQSEFINVDMAAKKRAKKHAKGNKALEKKLYKEDKKRLEARAKVLAQMQNGDFTDRTLILLKDVGPMVVILARLVASVVLSIMSIDAVKVKSDPSTVGKLKKIYDICMGIN